jgi:hypothetical protein
MYSFLLLTAEIHANSFSYFFTVGMPQKDCGTQVPLRPGLWIQIWIRPNPKLFATDDPDP